MSNSIAYASIDRIWESEALPSAQIGGGIPFLAMLGDMFPDTSFVVTGVLGPGSNAHGPNEYLHVPTAKRLTAVLARLLIGLARNARPTLNVSSRETIV